MSWPVDCANCGKQTLVDGVPGEKCIWCGKSPYKKEAIMQEQPSEPKRMTIRNKHLFIEEHKEEIIKDARKLKKREVLKKWGISNTAYYQIRKRYAPELIRQSEEEKTDDLPEALTEHERYLVLFGYQQAVREFLNVDKQH